MNGKQKDDKKLRHNVFTRFILRRRIIAHPLFSVALFLLGFGLISAMVALAHTTTTYAAAAKCYENVETYQNTYDVDTGEITRGFPQTSEVDCSQLRGHADGTLQANKCYVLRTIHVGLSGTPQQLSQWVEEANCNTEKQCAEQYGGIPVRAQPQRQKHNVQFASIELAIETTKCNATQANINAHCPSCMSPDDVPQDTQDHANGNPKATKYCKDEKGYTDLLLEACILGYKGDDCKLISSNPSDTDKKAYEACAAGREGGGFGPPPGNSECKTNIINVGCGSDAIMKLLGLLLDIMTAGVGIVAVGGIAYGSLLYTTAGGSQEQVKKAIGIIQNVIIGLVAYVSLYAFLQFLLPGGIF